MSIWKISLAALLAGSSGLASAQTMPLDQAARLFGDRESAWNADLSPSGRKIVFLTAGPGSSTLAKILDPDTKALTNLTRTSGRPESLEWCEFASETQLVCRYGGNVHYDGVLAYFSRMITLRSDGSGVQPLESGRRLDEAYVRQTDGTILDWLPDQDGSVLIARTYVPKVERTDTHIHDRRNGLGVDRLDLTTLRSKEVEEPRKQASRYLTDGRGIVRVMGLTESRGDTGQLTGKTSYRYRLPNDKEWKVLGEYNSRDNSGIWPVAVDHAANSVYLLEATNGRDALFRMALNGSMAKTPVASNDKVDISGVIQVDRGQPVIGYRYTDDRSRTVYFDPEFKKLASSLGRALPATPLIDFAAASRDGKALLVHASADTDPGAYYLLDRTTKRMEPVLPSRQSLLGMQLAPVRSISYPAADGTMVPAYVTMSKDGPAKARPAVVLPHGGPSARDSWGFDWLAQFLAARGYVVIQPNYRGSAGYGSDFLGENAFRDWKTAMSDISASGHYLVREGIADPNKLAIVGWSYGGYAALQSAVLEPDRYKAVVAIAPVTDLSLLKSDSVGFNNARLVREFIGSGENLKAGSPLQNASRIKLPVLLVHGDMDGNVGIAHSVKMAEALGKAGTPVELLRYKDLEHQLDDSRARTDMLTKIGQLLDRTIGK
ncbi:MAG TPA: alpha/beta fold hydrolase [Sphingomicrobium sp.]|nr:alpha/beta fold hydrolase [Sphingomicrobium sp.]